MYRADIRDKGKMCLTCIASYTILGFVREPQTFSQESDQLVVDIRIVHCPQTLYTAAALAMVNLYAGTESMDFV